MAKKKASQPRRRTPSRPLRGIETIAWWSVPAVGFVAIGCAATLAYLFFRHSNSGQVAQSLNNATSSKIDQTENSIPSPVEATAKRTIEYSTANLDDTPTESNQHLDINSGALKQNFSLPENSSVTTALACNALTKSIEYSGNGEIKFAPEPPSLEVRNAEWIE